MPPPPAEQLASRIFLGPALRAQPDRRLVRLVREGYETAFEEIVRRYRRPLDRFAAAIVGGRSEDVTQDAFSKALLALRGSEKEIELRPWLYRIVRNTALNELRSRPPATEELDEAIPGGHSAAVEAERRGEMAELMRRLRSLPEPQRAAIVMRELEGLSHEEIAAALGVSGGAARQAIHRARTALRDGFGLLVPLPLLRALFDHGSGAAAGAGGAVGAGAATTAGGGGGAALGGLGAAGTLKVGVATALIAGTVGAAVALQHGHGEASGPEPAAASGLAASNESAGQSPSGDRPASGQGSQQGPGGDGGHRGPGGGDGDGNGGHGGRGGSGSGTPGGSEGSGDGGPGPSGTSGHGGRGTGDSGDGSGGSHSGEGSPGGSHSGGGDGGDGGSGGGSGSGDGGSGGDSTSEESSGGEDGGSGSSQPAATAAPTLEPPPEDLGGDSGSGGSGSGSGDGASSSGSGGGEGGS